MMEAQGTLEKKLEENAILAADVVKKYLKNEIAGGDYVKTASLAIGHHNKYLATKGANDANKIVALRGISQDSKEFKEYLEMSMPELIPRKLIGKK